MQTCLKSVNSNAIQGFRERQYLVLDQLLHLEKRDTLSDAQTLLQVQLQAAVLLTPAFLTNETAIVYSL